MHLFIIGNGFDINHGYHTDYKSFRKYLYSHSYSILGIELSQYFPSEDSDLWNDFENELEFVDFEDATDFFVGEFTDDMSDKEWEREYSRNSELLDSFEEAPANIYPALCQALSDFITEEYSRHIPKQKKYFKSIFDNNSVFITFNYTKILEDIYKIQDDKVNHIHGIAYHHFFSKDDLVEQVFDEPTIIFGHANTKKHKYEEIDPDEYNAMMPNRCLRNMNKLLEKEYQLELFQKIILNQNIETVEIIGHDLGVVDEPYFKLLNKYLNKGSNINYWLWDIKKKKEKTEKLKELFPQNITNIIFYPEEERELRTLTFESMDSGIKLNLQKQYIGKEYPFYLTCQLPIYFNYSKNDYVHPSFIIETPDNKIVLKDGDWNKNCTVKNTYCFSFMFTYGYCNLVMLETPEMYQNKGFATAVLDLISDITKEYNRYIETIPFSGAENLKKIRFIHGEANSCGNQALNQERLIDFYRKNGFSIEEKYMINLYFE